MAQTRRVFDDLPIELRELLESNKEFIEIKSIFFIFLKKIKAELLSRDKPAEAARAFVILEYIKSELENFSKSFTPIHFEQKTQTIPKLFEACAIPSQPLNEGFTVSVKPKLYCSIKPTAKEGAFDWLNANDLGDIIQPQVNPRTLVGAMQELIETQGIEIPEKYFTSFIRNEAKVIKGKTKKTIEKDEDIFADLDLDYNYNINERKDD